MRKLYNKIVLQFRTKPLFLLLLPLFFIYSGYNELFGFLSISFVAINLLVIVVAVAFLFGLSSWLMKSKKQASVFTFFVALFCLIFGFLHDSLKQFNLPTLLTKYTLLLPFCVLLFGLLFIVIRKKKSRFEELFLFLNTLFVILLLSEIPNSIKRYKLDKSVNNLIDFRFRALNDYQPLQSLHDSLKPDIYFLLFDAMASSKGLRSSIGKDNYKLDSFLRKEGFYVAENASANYNSTIHSLSTTFNMDYLPPWIAPVANDPKAYFWGSASLLNNSLSTILKQEGYRISNYQPISFDNPDWEGDSFFKRLRKYHYSTKTLPGRIWRDIFWNYTKVDIDFVNKLQLQLVEKGNQKKKLYFDNTVSLIKKSCAPTGNPKFIYGHFMIPHEQYIFDSTGTMKTPNQTMTKSKEESENGYFSQVVFARKVIIELTNYIKKNNKKNTIIIVAGDHGYRTAEGFKSGYAFENLSAFYFPDQKYDLLYDSLSPVNTFRIVLNKYFTARLPLLKDSSILVTQQKETIRKSQKILGK